MVFQNQVVSFLYIKNKIIGDNEKSTYDDAPIVNTVPKYLFQQINNGFIHIGKEYGFLLKP